MRICGSDLFRLNLPTRIDNPFSLFQPPRVTCPGDAVLFQIFSGVFEKSAGGEDKQDRPVHVFLGKRGRAAVDLGESRPGIPSHTGNGYGAAGEENSQFQQGERKS